MTKTENFIKQVQDIFRFIKLSEETEDHYVFKFREYEVEVEKEEISSQFEKLKSLDSREETELFCQNSLEMLVKFDSRKSPSFGNSIVDAFTKEDKVNNVSYSLFSASDEYVVYFITKLSELIPLKELKRYFIMSSWRVDRFFKHPNDEDGEEFTPRFLDILKLLLRLDTIRVDSNKARSKEELEKLAYAYMFNLGINLDFPIYPLRYIDEFTRRELRNRRSTPEEVETPKRVYKNDLILHYQKGLLSISLDSQFLSYYHVMEYFFEEVYNEDILNTIQSELTKATFSYKKKSDIKSLIGIMTKKLKYRNEEFQINEEEALILTLKRYVLQLSTIQESLKESGLNLIDYYKSTEVPFSKGNKVNFEIEDKNEIYKNIGKRIYRTRNAIVHSKENGKNKYLPFKDDKELLKELPLMKYLAESIITGSSEQL